MAKKRRLPRLRDHIPEILAGALGLVLLGWLTLAMANPQLSAQLKEFQTLFTGLAAICAALIAYAAAMAGVRETRRQATARRNRRRDEVLLLLREELVQTASILKTLRQKVGDPEPSTWPKSLLSIAFETYIGITEAVKEPSLLPRRAVRPIAVIYGMLSRMHAAYSPGGVLHDAPHTVDDLKFFKEFVDEFLGLKVRVDLALADEFARLDAAKEND